MLEVDFKRLEVVWLAGWVSWVFVTWCFCESGIWCPPKCSFYVHIPRWWQLKDFLFSPQTLGFHDPIWLVTIIFFNGLVQPPTRYTWKSTTAMHAAPPHSQWQLHPAPWACFRQKAPKELWDNSPKFERMARKRACARNLILRVIGMRWYWRPLKIFSCNDADDAVIFVVWSLFLSDVASFKALTCYSHSCVLFVCHSYSLKKCWHWLCLYPPWN